MIEPVHVGRPPSKPVLIYDGECNFCCFWIRRWQAITGPLLEYRPYQDPQVPDTFPELARARLEEAVHLVDPSGAVYSGAEAAFRALATNPAAHGWLTLYRDFPGVAALTERSYGIVARHRSFFSALTRVFIGHNAEPPRYAAVRWLFLRGLGLIYLVAFLSLWWQVDGLIGSYGVLPAREYMDSARAYFDHEQAGLARYYWLPTWCWVSSSDRFLQMLCGAGVTLSLLLILGVAPALNALLLWSLYLSLTIVGRDFLSFQWDVLLLESGFLAVFFAPWQWLPRRAGEPPMARWPFWLLKWLLFRLMFESGWVKLLSGDPTWRNLSALDYHYETQPLPTWIGWYAHQGSSGWKALCLVLLFGIELVLPFFVFGPRRLRLMACVGFPLLQLVILLTGNYGFFNYLTMVLSLLLLDDQALKLAPSVWKKWRPPMASESLVEAPAKVVVAEAVDAPTLSHRPVIWLGWILAPLIVIVTLTQLLGMFGSDFFWLRPGEALARWAAPFRSINTYGLFAVMTTTRPEIIVEGSNDRQVWRPYLFRFKPGPLTRVPRFVAPHQPRLDWQMWFAALGSIRENRWFLNFCERLLEGSAPVLKLLAENPFPDKPPRYLRAVVYEYHFTNWATRRESGAWWRGELKGEYLPVISLRDLQRVGSRSAQVEH